MRRSKPIVLLSLLVIAATPALHGGDVPLAPGFTYQGLIAAGGTPFEGDCDFEFALFDDPDAGAQLGSTQAEDAVPVTHGTFSVVLDDEGQFGVDAFLGAERYLEISSRCPAGAGDFTLLAPRQRLTAAPYARFALAGNQGEPGPTGPPGPPGPPGPTSIASCPDGMTQVDLASSKLCYDAGTTSNWIAASQYCWDNFHAGLCSLQQWRTVVCHLGLPSPGNSWLPTVAGISTFALIGGCTGDAVATATYTSNFAGPCCLEWMSY
ncbi:MAG: hypothetical protein AB7G12_13735 [Thermoanaerobaculia bacterium]